MAARQGIHVGRELLIDVSTMSPEEKRAHPLLWVPSLYFAMGTPMIAVSVVAAIMYKNLGLTNTEIAAYTGAMYLPWVSNRCGRRWSSCFAPRNSSCSPWRPPWWSPSRASPLP